MHTLAGSKSDRIDWLTTFVFLLLLAAPLGAHDSTAQAPRPGEAIAVVGSDARQQWTRLLEDIAPTGTLVVEQTDADPQFPGRRHERLVQHYRGVRVWGASINRQLQGSNMLSAFGTVYRTIDIPTIVPKISPAEARAAIATLAHAPSKLVPVPELVILPKEDQGFTLTYSSRVQSPDGPMVYFIDATSGRVVWSYRDLQTQAADKITI